MPEGRYFRFIGGMAGGKTLLDPMPPDYGWPPPDTLLVREGDEGFEVAPLLTNTLVDVTAMGLVHLYERDPEKTSKLTPEQAAADPLFVLGAEYHFVGDSGE